MLKDDEATLEVAAAIARGLVTGIDEDQNVADALYSISRAVDRLGNADAATPLGGLEGLGMSINQSASAIASAIADLAEAIRECGVRM